MVKQITAMVAALLLLVLACGKSESGGNLESGGKLEKKEAAGSTSLVAADAPGPEGFDWAAAEPSGVNVEVPSGGDWKDDNDGPGVSSDELGIVVWVKKQEGVEAALLADYAASYIENNKQDAPKYALGDKKAGKVAAHPAMRIDGSFDNGTAFATRDYIVMKGGNALIVMVRGPVAARATVQAIADRVVLTAE